MAVDSLDYFQKHKPNWIIVGTTPDYTLVDLMKQYPSSYIKYCPGCGEKLPDFVPNPRPPKYIFSCIYDNTTCQTCGKEFFNGCKCKSPYSWWKIKTGD
jgi:hypothetical protein